MKSQQGTSAIEFAILASMFLMVLIGTLEFARLMMQFNAVSAMTQILARSAVVCDVGSLNADAVLHSWMPDLPDGVLNVDYLPSGCDVSNCQWVQVSTRPNFPVNSLNPFLGTSLNWPVFYSSLPRETLSSTASSSPNPLCLS